MDHAASKESDGFQKQDSSEGRKAAWDFSEQFSSGSQSADRAGHDYGGGGASSRLKKQGGSSSVALGKTKVVPRSDSSRSESSRSESSRSEKRPLTADDRPFSPLDQDTTAVLSRQQEASHVHRQQERVNLERERRERERAANDPPALASERRKVSVVSSVVSSDKSKGPPPRQGQGSGSG